MEAIDVFMLEGEVADLREKLAAADRDFHGLDKQWSDRYRSEKRLAAEEMANFRAAVVGALARLRAEVERLSRQRDSEYDYQLDYQYQAGLIRAVMEIDATIAALGLESEPQAE